MYSVFNIGEYSIPSRELFINIGTVVGLIVMFIVIHKTIKQKKKDVVILYSVCLLFSILGSGFIGGISQWNLQDNLAVKLMNGSAVNFSGNVLFFTVLFPFLYKIVFKGFTNFWENIKPAALYFSIQHMFSRIGCLMAGCCGGREYNGFLALHYSSQSTIGYYPVQPFEIIAMMTVLILIIWLYNSKKINVFCLFIIWFGIMFIVGDIFRDNTYDLRIIGLTIPQVVSCILIATGTIMNLKYRGVKV